VSREKADRAAQLALDAAGWSIVALALLGTRWLWKRSA
jgi:hypothetical protein